MYQNIFVEKNFNSNQYIVHLWDDRKGYDRFNYSPYAYRLDPDGKFKTIFGQSAKKVYSWNKWDEESGVLFESDVPLETRILVDKYYDSDDVPDNHRVMFYDIEVDSSNGLPNVQEADNEITAISFYDPLEDQYYVYLLDKSGKIKDQERDDVLVFVFQTERELLLSFLDKYEEISPTIISGWNCDYFDNPYMYRRMLKILGKHEANRLSPIKKVYFKQYTQKFVFAGVSSLDYLPLYKKFTYTQLSSYNLDNVSNFVLGRGKISYKGTLDRLYEEDINKFIDYSFTDTELVKSIDDKVKFIDLVIGICHKGHVPYEHVEYSSRWIEGAILCYLKKNGLVAPNKNKENRKLMDSDEKFAGAYVKSPEAEMYEWLYDLDFTSLYPSIMVTLNISPETKMGKIENWDAEKHLNDKSITYDATVKSEKYELTGNDIDKILEEMNLAVSSNGVFYKKDQKGIIPTIINQWFGDKEEYDRLMKEHGNAGNEEKSNYYKARRTVSKVILNSVYGVMGLPIFRFYDIDNAEAVTLTGRQAIKFAERIANQYYNNELETNNKDYCIYIDTDSVDVNSEIITDRFGKTTIGELCQKLIHFDGTDVKTSRMKNRIFLFPENLKTPCFDGENIVMEDIDYIELHETEKDLFRIEVDTGEFVVVTEDHSIMVVGNGDKLKEVKPQELSPSDKIILLST